MRFWILEVQVFNSNSQDYQYKSDQNVSNEVDELRLTNLKINQLTKREFSLIVEGVLFCSEN